MSFAYQVQRDPQQLPYPNKSRDSSQLIVILIRGIQWIPLFLVSDTAYSRAPNSLVLPCHYKIIHTIIIII